MIHTRKIFFIIISFLCIAISLKETYAFTASVEIEFSKLGTAKLVSFSITEKNYDYFFTGKGFGNYSVKILDKDNKILYSEKFGGLDFIIQKYTETDIITEEVDYINKSFRLFLPDNFYLIKFYKEDNELVSISLPDYICNNNLECESDKGESEYLCPQDCPPGYQTTTISTIPTTLCGNGKCEDNETQDNCCKDCACPEGKKCFKDKCIPDLCGNGFCEPKFGENYKACKQDCPSGSKDEYCDSLADGVCDPDCTKDEDIDCEKPNDTSFIYIIIVAIFLVLIISIIVRSRRES